MTTFQAYLRSPKVQKTLTRRPGEEGFSLIELVVVVAVLAILAAIAIPAFTSISDNAAQAAAKNTIAQIAKECAVKKANLENNPSFNVPSLNGYDIVPANGSCAGTGDLITANREQGASTALPGAISYNVVTGAKTCTAGGNAGWCQNNTW